MNYCFLKVIHFAYEQLKQKPSSLIELRELHTTLEQYCKENDLQRKYKEELSNVMNDDFLILKNGRTLYIGLSDSIKLTASTLMIGDHSLTEKLMSRNK